MRARTFGYVARALSLSACLTLPAFAGGPMGMCGNAPIKYPGAGTVTLNYDQGTLGTRTKAQADALVTQAVSLWTNVATASVTLARGPDMPVDVTIANYATYINSSAGNSDGLNPVVYDTDGSIIDAIFGVGAKNNVLGYAGSYYSSCQYVEGKAVVSGFLNVSDITMKVVLAHEVGHMIGLTHTQIDAAEGIASTSNYPLMYPAAYRNSVSLHEDDIASVSALYPDASLNTVYGQLSGNFTLADGTTAVRGANIWAKESITGKVYSIVSDYLMQNTGYFKLLLPVGTYTLHAEAIQTMFHGGSFVGPYATNYPANPAAVSPSYSFLPPLYVNDIPMAPLTLGNGAPTQITITAGCAATAAFRFDGTGSIGGNCVIVTPPSAPTIISILSGDGSATVAFAAPVSNGGSIITSYTVTCAAAGQTTRANTGPSSPISVSNLTGGATYSCSVTARNSAGTSAPSTEVSITPVTVPGAPIITGITTGNHSATINFTAPSNDGGSAITGYAATCTAAGQSTRTNTGISSPIVVANLTNGVAYSCSVTASNHVGTSLSSADLLINARALNMTPIWMLLLD